jgi:dynactin-4
MLLNWLNCVILIGSYFKLISQTAVSVSATGGWPERENVHAARISSLLEHYKILALRERQEKERKKFIPRRSYLHFSDKFGLSAVMARKRAGLPPLGGVGLKDDAGSIPELNPSEAVEEVESLPADIYTKPVNLLQGETVVAYAT